MDVNQTNSQTDGHNTNQNEAALMSRPSLDPDQLSNPQQKENELDNTERVLSVSDNIHNHDKAKGTCNPTNTMNTQQNMENSSVEHTVVDTKHPQNLHSSPEPSEMINDSPSSKTPPDRMVQNISSTSNANPSETSTTDISVTSDEDIKVTCRLSSTPVNSSLNKNLNESDCSMSSVGDASPITSMDNSKMLSNNPSCHNIMSTGNPQQHTMKDGDKIDDNIVYLQPQVFSNKLNDNRNTQLKPDQPPHCNLYYADRNQPLTPTSFQQTYSADPTQRGYSVSPYDYQPPFVDPQCGYNDYNICDQRSLTDIKTRHDMQQINISPQPDLCCYPMSPGAVTDREYFVYPSIYVSNAGLISVLLRNDMSVEMTVDRTIRVVSHNHMMAVATDSKGTAASLYHPAAKIFQMGYNTDIATDTFRAKITQGEAIFFSNGTNCFKLQDSDLKPMPPIKFSDILRDQSVNLLFSSEGYGESLVATCMQVAAQAEYANLPKGGVIVRINGVKVTQSGCGDVTVVTGAKFIRLSPHNGTTRLGNRFVDIEVERDWSVKLTRGTHSFVTNKKRTMVSNGKMEAGFDENNSLKATNLQSRHSLIAEPNMVRRPAKRITRAPPGNASTCFTPRRRMTPLSGRGGGINTC